ncbi:hypothetical protein WA026_017637 [Henosepilachna vigintioctopunctata]|uniref:EGF-like domain-containing protein n=1 Tax=Henosepilachna vigintioctopunctata TaxID=420089 RepID=A0AAW1UV49_9CUCU
MLQFVLTISFITFVLLNPVHGFVENQCNVHDLRSKQCEEFETCDETSNSCQCLPGYVKVDSYCEKIEQNSGSSGNILFPPNSSSLVNDKDEGGSAVTGYVLLFFLLFSLIGGIFVTRKYNLLQVVRNKVYSFRRSHYDEFMIGQDVDDDPPLR